MFSFDSHSEFDAVNRAFLSGSHAASAVFTHPFPQRARRARYSESGKLLPSLRIGRFEPGCVRRFLVFNFSLDYEPVGFSNVPVVIPHALSTRAFTAETLDPHSIPRVEHLDPVFGIDRVRIVTFV